MSWTRYQVHAKPRELTEFERASYGTQRTRVVIIDPATGIELPPEGLVVNVISGEVRRFWDRVEADGDCSISLPAERTPTPRRTPARKTAPKPPPAGEGADD